MSRTMGLYYISHWAGIGLVVSSASAWFHETGRLVKEVFEVRVEREGTPDVWGDVLTLYKNFSISCMNAATRSIS